MKHLKNISEHHVENIILKHMALLNNVWFNVLHFIFPNIYFFRSFIAGRFAHERMNLHGSGYLILINNIAHMYCLVGAFLAPLWRPLAHFRRLLAPFWRLLAHFCSLLSHFWRLLGRFWCLLAQFWYPLALILARLGTLLTSFGTFFILFGAF